MSEPTMKAPNSGVTVRMYNTGFGDCLLLAFPTGNGGAHYMLIDFGVHHQYPDREARVRLIAEDIAQATGQHLHTVVITHEHTDHLYGFKYGRDVFAAEAFQIDMLWLGWTEDPHNALAQELKARYGIQARALAGAVEQLAAAHETFASTLRGVLGFAVDEALSVSGGESDELQFLRVKAAGAPHNSDDYLHPGGAPIALPGVDGVNVYVLGPPEDLKWMRSLERKSELYPEEGPVDEDVAFAAAIFAASAKLEAADKGLFDRTRPFDPALGISRAQVGDSPYAAFFRAYYGLESGEQNGPAWRRIDADWLGAAEQLALKIDSKTNNTSVVLALELAATESKKVLLFAADAQVGNWLSWHELVRPGDTEKGSMVRDLLRRTVLYKVGHHGSHNATLREKGLELMTSPDLVAMIPVDQAWANEVQRWQHPAPVLYARLVEKTRGRVIRTDRIPEGEDPPPYPELASEQAWTAFVNALDWDRSEHKLWIQFTVAG